MREIQLGRVYRHFKGDHYLVEAVAKDSETGEPYVVYRKLYGDGGLWLRPLAMFLSVRNTRTRSRNTALSFWTSPAAPGTKPVSLPVPTFKSKRSALS